MGRARCAPSPPRRRRSPSAAAAAALSPEGLGFGDVKLLGLLGLVLGWFGWGVLLAGVFLGLLTGGLVSLVLLVTRRAGWRTALPFGPPLLVGAVLALALAAGPSLSGRPAAAVHPPGRIARHVALADRR